MPEQLLIKFKLPQLQNLDTVHAIVITGFEKTGNKFSVNFNGSKGYLSHVEITCEGIQKERNNLIWIEELQRENGSLQIKDIEIFHCPKLGVRVSVS